MESFVNFQARFALVLVILIGMATIAIAQPTVDMTVTDAQLVFSANNWRIVPEIMLVALGDQTSHQMDIQILLDDEPLQSFGSLIEYDPSPNSCYATPWPACDGGDCPDIYGFYLDLEGFCISEGFASCGCSWILNPASAWMLIGEHETATIIVDPENLVEEINEDNNVLVLDLKPVPTDSHVWSAIKVQYR